MTEAENAIRRKHDCLTAAHEAVCGDRQLNYGTPEDNFGRIATLWNAYMVCRQGGRAQPISPMDVSIFNIMIKVARIANIPGHKDSWIDIAGYAACGYDITTKTTG